MSEYHTNLQPTYNSASSLSLMKASDALSRPLAIGALTKALSRVSLVPLAESHNTLATVVAQSNWLPIGEMISNSLAPLADAQRSLSEVLTQSLAIPNLGFVVAKSNATIAGALESIQAIHAVTQFQNRVGISPLYTSIFGHVQEIGETYRELLRETAGIAASRHNLAEIRQTWARMVTPSSAVANFAHSLRLGLVPAPAGTLTLAPLSSLEDPRGLLKRLLADLNPELVDKWEGAWQALGSSNPDRLSQAPFSFRELLRMVLDGLVSDVGVDLSEQNSKRKGQVRRILRGKEAEFADAMAKAVAAQYDYLSKPAHTSYRNEVAVQAALMAGDGLLLFLLSHGRCEGL